jgi:hypothetical protein
MNNLRLRNRLHKALMFATFSRHAVNGLSAASWATLGGAFTLSLAAATPAAAATVVIDNTTINSTVSINSGDSLQVTPTGIIDVNPGQAVTNDGSGTTIGSISNAGSITSGANDAIALYTTVSTGIDNTGNITAAFDGIFIDTGSVIQGSIHNDTGGTISAGGDGIHIRDTSTVNSNIINNGIINSGIDGIIISWGSRVDGNISNNGTINAGEDGIDLTAHLSGPAVGVGGNISNTGQIIASDNGIDINTRAVVTGAVLNSGRIESVFDGIFVTDNAKVLGGITNTTSGIIKTDHDGIHLSRSANAQSITNAGNITAVQSGIEVDSTSEIVGAISNTGSITGDYASIFIEAGSVVGGGISNSGTLTGPLGIFGDNGLGSGIDFNNSGTVDIGQSESFISGNYTQQISGTFSLTLRNFVDYLAAPISIIGDAVFANTLDLHFVPEFAPIAGDRFTLFDINGTRTGSFGNFAQGALVASVNRVDVFIDYTAEGNIELHAVPEPGGFALLGIGAFGWFASQRRKG